MNGRSMVMLVFAVVSGLGAMYGTAKLLSKDRDKAGIETQDVLVAARDLKVEELLKPDAVKVVSMPKSSVPAGSFTSCKEIEERWVQIKTLENEPILDRKLAPKGSPPGLVARIPKGMRAFTLEVTESTGVSGFVLPDHRVDVVQVRKVTNSTNTNNPSSGQNTEPETVLEDVLVLASGQTSTRPDDRTIMSRTVTLAVTPEQVGILVAARDHGPLSLALRGVNDHARVERSKPPPPKPEPVVVTAFKLPPPPKPAPPPLRKVVTIYRGGIQPPVRVAVQEAGNGDADLEDDDEGLSGLAGGTLPPFKTFGQIGTRAASDVGSR